jgi:hypothetical protein
MLGSMRRSNPSSSRPAAGEPARTGSTIEELTELLSLAHCWYEPFPFDRQLPRIERDRIVLPGREPGIAPWRLGEGVELPVRYGNLTLGRYVLVPRVDTCGVSFPGPARIFAIELATHAGHAIAETLIDQENVDTP